MRDKQNENRNSIAALVESDSFLNLEPKIQKQIIDAVNRDKEKQGGFIGKLLGNKPVNLAIHAVLILCLALLLVVVIDNLHAYRVGEPINMELVNIVIPVITLTIGYIFGRSAR